jgi:phage shock protein PspC (stress-responsive transcriptional regulator)
MCCARAPAHDQLMETNPESHDDMSITDSATNAATAGTATMESDTTESDTTESDTTESDTTESDTTESDTTESDTTENDDSNHPSDDEVTATETMNADSNSERVLWSPPAPPPPPGQHRSWLDVPIARDRQDGRVAGVVAGVSKAYGFDRRTTRVAVAIGALVIPGIVALYIAGLIFLPGRDDEARTLRAIATDRRRRPLMIVLGIAAIATGFGSWAVWGGLGWGFALVAIGVALWLAPNLGRRSATDQGLPIPSDQTSPWSTPTVSPTTWTSPVSRPSVSAPNTSPAMRRRRYPVQAVALGAASVGALVAGIGNSASWWNISTYSIVLTVLIALITATVVGAIVNRSWFGIPMLLILGACTVALGLTHPDLDGGIGQRTFRPTTVADAKVAQHLGIGQLTIDLTDVPFDTQPLTVEASVGYGQVRVIVPADAELRILSDVNAGHVVVNGEETSAGFHRDDTLTVPARSAGADHTIVLDLGVGAGEISVTSAGS